MRLFGLLARPVAIASVVSFLAAAVPPSTGLAASRPPATHAPQPVLLSWVGLKVVRQMASRAWSTVLASSPPSSTHDTSMSTPWTAFTMDVNVVGGNVVRQYRDLTIPSTGLATTVIRTYNSTAAANVGPFGYGWSWSYGMHVDTGAGTAVVSREDGRTDTYTLSGGTYTPPTGVYD